MGLRPKAWHTIDWGEKARMRDYRRDLPGSEFTLERATNPGSQHRNGC